jgi:hypothetical protein
MGRMWRSTFSGAESPREFHGGSMENSGEYL